MLTKQVSIKKDMEDTLKWQLQKTYLLIKGPVYKTAEMISFQDD